MPIYTFICPDNHKKDRIVKLDQKSVKCDECGKTAKKLDFDAGVKNGQSFRFNYLAPDA